MKAVNVTNNTCDDIDFLSFVSYAEHICQRSLVVTSQPSNGFDERRGRRADTGIGRERHPAVRRWKNADKARVVSGKSPVLTAGTAITRRKELFEQYERL